MNEPLYLISEKYRQLFDKDELSAEDLEALQNTSDDLHDKAIAVASYILNQQLQLAGISDAIKRMQDRADKIVNKVDHLSLYLKEHLIKCGIKEITDHPEFEIKIKTNPPKVDILDQTLIPPSYFVVKTSINVDKKAIKEAIDKGMDIQGVKLIQETRLQIK